MWFNEFGKAKESSGLEHQSSLEKWKTESKLQNPDSSKHKEVPQSSLEKKEKLDLSRATKIGKSNLNEIHQGEVKSLDNRLEKSGLTDEDKTEISSIKSWLDLPPVKYVYKAKGNFEKHQSMKLTQTEARLSDGSFKDTPSTDHPEMGRWTGTRGNSTYITNPDYIPKNSKFNPDQKTFSEMGIDKVSYKNGEIQLQDYAQDTEKIFMTANRINNFSEADQALADKKGWTRKEVTDYRKDNHLTWHERQDMKTIDLVPTEVNGNLKHRGGVSFIKRDTERAEEMI